LSSLFSWHNAIDKAAMSAGSEASNMRSYNLGGDVLKRAWRALSTETWFEAALLEDASPDILGLFGATLSSGDTVRHRLYDSGGIAVLDETVDAGIADGYGQHIYFPPSGLTVSKWRCDIVASSRASVGYFDIGRAWLGPGWKPSIGYSVGIGQGWNSTAQPVRAPLSGVIFPGDGASFRSTAFTLDYMSDDDRNQALELMRTAGTTQQVLWVPDTTDGDPAREAMLGKFTEVTQPKIAVATFPRTYSQDFSIQEDC
jgi:hypothetical protein